MNDVVKATNKNIKMIMQNMVVTYKDWHEMLPFALDGSGNAARSRNLISKGTDVIKT
jgi:hypothetical protein